MRARARFDGADLVQTCTPLRCAAKRPPISLLRVRGSSFAPFRMKRRARRRSPLVEGLEGSSVLCDERLHGIVAIVGGAMRRRHSLLIAGYASSGRIAGRILRYHKARPGGRALCSNRPLTIDRVSFNANNLGRHWGNSWGGDRATFHCGDCGDCFQFFAEAVQKSASRADKQEGEYFRQSRHCAPERSGYPAPQADDLIGLKPFEFAS